MPVQVNDLTIRAPATPTRRRTGTHYSMNQTNPHTNPHTHQTMDTRAHGEPIGIDYMARC
jgi:hypothetical protein